MIYIKFLILGEFRVLSYSLAGLLSSAVEYQLRAHTKSEQFQPLLRSFLVIENIMKDKISIAATILTYPNGPLKTVRGNLSQQPTIIWISDW